MKSIVLVLAAGLIFASCSNNSPTTPTTTTPVAPPSVTETWQATLAVGATRFYSFSVALNGTVNLTLASLTENGEDSAAQLGLALGTPAGTGCAASTSVTMAAAADPQITGTYAPGIYCARVADVGNLGAPGSFRILIAHP
jgi:hypothetical protein